MVSKAHKGEVNFYSQAKNDPEVLARRQKVIAELDAAVQHIVTHNPGRVPSWDAERVMQMDRFCLEHGKRCVMWDDEGAGFYLMLNWDWLRNRPAAPQSPGYAMEPGWWVNVRQMLRPPLLDPSLPEERLAAWVDEHTMRVHHALLDRLGQLRLDEETQRLVLDDPYWQQLQALPPWGSAGKAAASGGADVGSGAQAAV